MVDHFPSRNFRLHGPRTSFRFEPAFWSALHEIAAREDTTIAELITSIEDRRDKQASTLASAVRVFAVSYYRALAAERDLAPREWIKSRIAADRTGSAQN